MKACWLGETAGVGAGAADCQFGDGADVEGVGLGGAEGVIGVVVIGVAVAGEGGVGGCLREVYDVSPQRLEFNPYKVVRLQSTGQACEAARWMLEFGPSVHEDTAGIC